MAIVNDATSHISSVYSADWFSRQQRLSARSAAAAVPVILDLLPPITSVVDVGCGVGCWLEQFKSLGINTVKGYDGGGALPEQMRIPPDHVERVDLAWPPMPKARYDLAICLEVAEHLSADAAPRLIGFLTSLSDIVVFSAAIPCQGGRNHINEQPLSYWRGLFASQSYEISNSLRARLWNDSRIAYYYRQNMIIAWREGSPCPETIRPIRDGELIDVVHPELLLRRSIANERRRRLGSTIRDIVSRMIFR